MKWHGRYVATVAHIVGLERGAKPALRRELPSQGFTRLPPAGGAPGSILLQRAVVLDAGFWARLNNIPTPGDGLPATPQVKGIDLVIEAVGDRGVVAKRFRVHRCSANNLGAPPTLEGKANTVAIENLLIEHEGWEAESDAPEVGDA